MNFVEFNSYDIKMVMSNKNEKNHTCGLTLQSRTSNVIVAMEEENYIIDKCLQFNMRVYKLHTL